MKKKPMEPGHLLGEFLWKNHVITATQLARAIDFQKKLNRNLGIMLLAESLLGDDELALVHARLTVTEETFEQALINLGLLAADEIAEVQRVKKDFRIPLGIILQNQKAVSAEKFRNWLRRFENQRFNQRELKAHMKKIPLFHALPAATITRICAGLKYKYCTAGEYLYRTGDESDGIFIVESGLIRLLADLRSETRIIGSRHNGDTFGMPGCLAGTPRSESALAITDTVLWRMRRVDFLQLLEKNPRLGQTVAREMGDAYQNALMRIKQRGLVSDSKITVVLLDVKGPARQHAASHLVDALVEHMVDDALIVCTLSGLRLNSVRKTAAAPLESARPQPTGRGRVSYVYLHPVETSREFDALSVWLRRQTKKYAAVVFVVAPGNKNFRRFIMGLCRRSVTIARQSIPEFARFLRAGRDRLYLLATDDRAGDQVEHERFARETPGVAVPTILTPARLERAVAGIARWLAGRSVGIAFGGGGARALAHLGVLEVLELIHLPVDMISGVSAGAHFGGMRAAGWRAKDMIEHIRANAIQKKGHPFNDYTIPRRSLIRGRKYRSLLERAFGELNLADTEIPFFPVATDLRTGKQFVISHLSMRDAVLASGAAPGIFPPYPYRDAVLGDGGMINNIPASVLKEWEVDFVLCINISIDPSRSAFNPERVTSIIQQALDIFVDQSIKGHLDYTDFEIKPEVDEFKVTDHRRGDEIIEKGREAARLVVPRLVRTLRKRGIFVRES